MTRPVPTLIASALACLLAAPLPALAGKADDTLNVALDHDIETFDVYMTSSRSSVITSRMVFDGLIERDPATNEYKPLLAKAYRQVDDKTLEFDLREGVRFHNGETFDADDVVATIEFMKKPDSGIKSRANVEWIDKVEKLGPYKLRLVMSKPFPAALEYLSGALPIYPKDYYAAHARDMATKPVGTGPYKVSEVQTGTRFVFEKNPEYFAASPKGKPAIGRIVIRVIPDINTQVAELMAGQIDWAWRVPADQADRLARVPKLQVRNGQTMRISYLQFSPTAGGKPTPFADVRVRKALAHAIDRENIMKNLVRGESKLLNAPCHPEQVACSQDVTRYAHDPAKARQLLAEAGLPNGFAFDWVVMAGERSNAEAMVGDLAKVGIQARLNPLQYAAARDKIRGGEAPLAYMTWGSYSINDAAASTGNFFKGGPEDTARDAEVKAWLEQGDATVDAAQRKALYAKALGKIASEAYWLPLWSHNINYAYSADVNFTPATDEIPRFYATRWK